MNHEWKPNLKDKLVGAALWGAGVSWLFPMLGSMTVIQSVLRVPSDRIETLNRLYCKGQIALTGTRWRAVVDPAVDPKTPYMFAQNHVNHFDHVTLYRATPHFKQGLEREDHFSYPFYGWFMKARGTIPVKKGERGQSPALVARMRAEVERGHSLLVFPEGTRSRDGHVGPFKTGVFYAAVALQIPIVPVAVTGMYEVMRKGTWVIRPGHEVTVYVDAPVPTAGMTDEDVPALAEKVRGVVAARVDAYYGERPGDAADEAQQHEEART